MQTAANEQAQIDGEDFADELKPGTTLLQGQYTIERFINSGGFGITYLAKDSLDRQVVIKECFPGSFCRRSNTTVGARSRAHQNEFKAVVKLFVQEARSLSKLKHPNIVGVHQVFEDNETAYMALDYIDGHDMLEILEDPNRNFTPRQIQKFLMQVLDAVDFIHGRNVLHRDISPDNILLDQTNKPILIDFGAAREEAAKGHRVLTAMRVVKDGYSPQEFYIAGSAQSPSSDLYSLAASFYHLIVGEAPPNSQVRLAAIAGLEPDPYVSISTLATGYDKDFMAAIDKALNVFPKDRIQSAREWLDKIDQVKRIRLAAERASDDIDLKVIKMVAAESHKHVAEQSEGDALEIVAGPSAASDADSMPPIAGIIRESDVAEEPAAKSKRGFLLGSVAAVAVIATVAFFVLDIGGKSPAIEALVDAPTFAPVAIENVSPAFAENTVDVALEAVPVAIVVAPALPVEVIAEQEVAIQPTKPEIEIAAVTSEPVSVAPEPTQSAVVDVPSDSQPSVLSEAPELDFNANSIDEFVVVAPVVRLETLSVPVDIARPVLAATPSDTELAGISADVLETAATPVVIEATESLNETVNLAPQAENPILELSAVMSGRLVDLPFTTNSNSDATIASLKPGSASWMLPGQKIKSVNGIEVSTVGDITEALRSTVDSSQATEVDVFFGVQNPDDDTVVGRTAQLPVVNEVALLDGTRFQTSFTGDKWQTTVAAVTQQADTQIQVGDVLIAYMATGEKIEAETTIVDILSSEVDAGTTLFNFAVNRNGETWVVSFEYDAVGDQ